MEPQPFNPPANQPATAQPDSSSETALQDVASNAANGDASLNVDEIAARISPPPVQFQNVRVADVALSAPPQVDLFAAANSSDQPISAPVSAPILSRPTTLPPETTPSVVAPSVVAPSVAAPRNDFAPIIAKSDMRPVALGVLNSFLLGGVLACGLLGIGFLLGRGSGEGRVLDVVSNTSVSAGESTVISAVKAVGPAVMNVDTTFGGATGSKEFLPKPGEMSTPQQGKGTGVVIDSKRGLMLTNAHVVAGAQKIQVTTRDGQKYTGRVLGFERQNDIAVVELNSKILPAAKLAPLKSARDFQIGETAIAIGNPFAQANTVTVGVVSATGRTIPVPDNEHGGAFKLTDMIQTDAAINPGNSGGPLCNSKGEVIGINTAIYGIGTGLGFAIPINKARAVADRIIKKGRAPVTKKVGFQMRAITDATKEELGLKDKNGALVQSVEPNSPPAKAGLLSGDIVQKIDGVTTPTPDAIARAMNVKKSGDAARIEILRNGSKRTLTWKVGK